MLRNLILLTFLVSQGLAQTPVIGGTCKLGTADVQIGGKQTQFFLKCETTADSADGEGVWVVKSRAAAAAAPAPIVPAENTQPQQHPKARKPASPNICEQDNGARENEACAVSATCLQAHNDFPSSYLQCDQTTLRWVRKSCQENFLFNFEQQTCIVPKRMSSLSHLCSDGSPPNNTCQLDQKCPKGYFCTAQKVCCPSTALQASNGCSMVCTIDESCPKGMTCQNNCCEERKLLRHPKVYRYATVEATNTIFEVDNDIFDSAAIESFPTQRPQKIEEVMAPGITPTPTRTTEPPKLRCLSTEESNSSGQQANGLVCTFSSCSNNNPCSVGTCNNGYCCSSGSNSAPAIINSDTSTNTTNKSNQTETEKPNKKKHRKPKKKENPSALDPLIQNDFPVGPPGYGFPEHLSKLDEVLVRAQGDGVSCAGGFSSSLICSAGSECPAGLHCDMAINLCCPLLLPLNDPKNPKKRKTKRRKQKQEEEPEIHTNVEMTEEQHPTRFSSFSSCGCMTGGSSNCVGCQNAPQIITIPQNSCPGGGYSVGGCSSGYCATGYSCIQNQCCPSYNSAPRISVYTCPSGGNAVGACMSGRCASGYTCSNNVCCPQTTTTNPFVCSDGTQAAGGCVNGLCGTGYTCSNGLCCVGSSSTTVKCLDGSDAVGACIPSCTGDGCGGVQVSYYCGSGYTCTTGNICCAINSCPNGGTVLGPTINGLCPTGYTVQGSLCCSATCSDGSTGLAAVNGVCVAGYTLTNGVCCPSTVTCTDEISIGPCTGTGFNGGCPAGYACDSNQVNCCPVVTYTVESCQVGPAIDGLCPPGYVVVYIPNSPLITNGVNPGTCIDLQCTTGLCAAANQIGECDTTSDLGTCPTGYTCFTNAGICCQTTTFSRLRIGNSRPMAQNPNYGRPLHSYMPPRFGGPSSSSSCSDGSLSSGPCMNGLCGIGLECQNGQCCSPSSNKPAGLLQSKCPSGDTAVSGCFPNGSCGTGFECVSSLNLCCPPGQPQTSFPSFPGNNNNNGFNNNNNNNHFGSMSPRPIGARCQLDGECVGHNDGLSMCHAGVCQCSPIAYTQGIACVRRKSFQMNDDPVIDASDDKSNSLQSVNV